MRIALVTCSFLPRVGGAEFVVHNLAQQWAGQGHDVVVINAVTDRKPENAAYAVRRFRLLRGSDRFGFHRFPFARYARRGLGRELEAVNPDFISVHYAYPTAYWMADLKRPFVTTCHGQDITPFEWGYRRRYGVESLITRSLRTSSRVIAISTYAQSLVCTLGVDPSRVVHIPNGVDVGRFRKAIPFNLRERFALSASAQIVLSVGRDHPAKDYGTGIRAFAQVASAVPNAYYLLLGRSNEKWQPLVNELGLHSRVILCPGLYGDELVAAYQQADVFLSCSVQEMFPLVVAEAMAAGLPAVVTDVSGSQDMIHSTENGWVVAPGQVDEMSNALVRLLTDASMRTRMSRTSLDRSLDYSWERVSRMYLALS